MASKVLVAFIATGIGKFEASSKLSHDSETLYS